MAQGKVTGLAVALAAASTAAQAGLSVVLYRHGWRKLGIGLAVLTGFGIIDSLVRIASGPNEDERPK